MVDVMIYLNIILKMVKIDVYSAMAGYRMSKILHRVTPMVLTLPVGMSCGGAT